MRKKDLLKSYPAAMQQKGEAYIDLVTGGRFGDHHKLKPLLHSVTRQCTILLRGVT